MTYDADADANDLPPAVARAAEQWRPDYDPPTSPSGRIWTPDELAELSRELDDDMDPDTQAELDAWMETLTATDAPQEPSADERAQRTLRSRLVSGTNILDIPEPEWMVDGVIPGQTITGLVGPPGCGKTFLALDLALSVLTGKKWQGRTTKVDPTRGVLWLAGEGASELGKRTRAWCAHYGYDNPRDVIDNLHALPGGLRMQDPLQAGELTQLVRELDVQLVVVDTLSRHIVGGDENGPKDMGLMVDALEQLAALDATVLVIHHLGKDASRGSRGHNSFLGALRSELTAAEAPGGVSVKHTKANNSTKVEGWWARLTQAGINPQTGDHLSVVPVRADEPTPIPTGDLAMADKMLAILDDLDPLRKGVPTGQWQKACKMHANITQYKYRQIRDLLETQGRVHRPGHQLTGYVIVDDVQTLPLDE